MKRNGVDVFFSFLYLFISIVMLWASGYMFGLFYFIGRHSSQGIDWTGLYNAAITAFFGIWGIVKYQQNEKLAHLVHK